MKNTAPETAENPGRTDIAKHLVEVTEKIPGISDATAVVLGRYSVVGIDVDDNLERSKVESIKYTVAQALKTILTAPMPLSWLILIRFPV